MARTSFTAPSPRQCDGHYFNIVSTLKTFHQPCYQFTDPGPWPKERRDIKRDASWV
jgi:hypothetical protein